MSVSIMSKVFYTDYPSLSYTEQTGSIMTVSPPTAKIVMLAIADSSDDYGENSWNSYERLAIKTSLSRRTVIRVVRALKESEYICIDGISFYGTNNFKINLNKLGEIPPKKMKGGVTLRHPLVTLRHLSSDATSPDSSLTILNHPMNTELQEIPIKKNGDHMEKEEYLASVRESLAKGLNSPLIGYAHYPERLRPVVERMERLWFFRPPERSKTKGSYAFWVEACSEILDGCAEFGIGLLDDLYVDWSAYMDAHNGCAPFAASTPKSLVNAVRGKAALLRSGSRAPFWRLSDSPRPVHQSKLDI